MKKQPRRNGVITVEIAIILPVLFGLMVAAYDVTRVNMLRHTAQAAAYEGARRGIVPGATLAEIEAECTRVTSSVGVRQANITVNPATITRNTPSVEVIIEIPLRNNTLLASPFFGSIDIEGRTTLTRESL